MKTLVGLLSLVLSLASTASSGETKKFTYDGTQDSVELLLSGEKTHTEYRYEQQLSTCYRTQIAGHQTICTGGGYYGGGNPSGYPGGYYGRSCYQQPVYRQVAYSCMRTIQVPYEVRDYSVDAKVIVDITKLADISTPGEQFIVTLNGDDLSIKAVGSKKFFIMLKKQNLRASMNGSVKFIDGHYGVELIEASPILKTLNMTGLSLENSLLRVDLGPIANRTNIGLTLEVGKKKMLSGTMLFNRELDASEVIISDNHMASLVSIDLQKLGVTLVRGKYRFIAKAFFKATGKLMNESQFGKILSTSKMLRHKVK